VDLDLIPRFAARGLFVQHDEAVRIREGVQPVRLLTVEHGDAFSFKPGFEEMGELSIQFGSLDELNGLIEKLRA
jgi:hypothetical protein